MYTDVVGVAELCNKVGGENWFCLRSCCQLMVYTYICIYMYMYIRSTVYSFCVQESFSLSMTRSSLSHSLPIVESASTM